MLSGGKETIDDYLDWLGKYQGCIHDLKALETKLLNYQGKLDSSDHKKKVDAFRRKIIKLRRELAQADLLLNDLERGSE